jgi:hypothetical protein
VFLELLTPLVATRDCEHCQKYWYDEETGFPLKNSQGGLRLRVIDKNPPPCRVPQLGCTKGTPENSRALSDKNRRAYRHYLRCVVTGRWPDDEVVLQNAATIRKSELDAERYLAWKRDKRFLELRADLLQIVAARSR